MMTTLRLKKRAAPETSEGYRAELIDLSELAVYRTRERLSSAPLRSIQASCCRLIDEGHVSFGITGRKVLQPA